MYYPPSQIKTNLYTNGNELVYASDKTNYQGNYFKTSDGNYYTGKTPNDKPNNLLLAPPPNTNNDPELYSGGSFTPTTNQYTLPEVYVRNSSLNVKGTPPSKPIQLAPIPTKSQYKIGEFQRYFTKKSNEISYTEISKKQFNRFVEKAPTVDYILYQPFQLPWVISGNRKKAYQVNKKTVERVANKLNLYGFKSYFKEEFSQYFKKISGDK